MAWYPVDLFRNDIRQDASIADAARVVALLLWLFLTLSILVDPDLNGESLRLRAIMAAEERTIVTP